MNIDEYVRDRVNARMTQTGYSRADAERILRTEYEMDKPKCMTIDAAKAELLEIREAVEEWRDNRRPLQALDIALWLMDREDKLRKQRDPWLEEWLREYDLEHPRPGSEGT